MDTSARPDPFAVVAARLNPAQRPGARWMSGYARAKLRTDPLYRAALAAIPPDARVLDLGCGMGLLGLLLDARRTGNTTHGIEWDEAKARFGQQLAGESAPTAAVVQGDLLKEPWPPAEVVAALDVLHYLTPPIQREVILRIGTHLPPGGWLLLRVMDARARGLARVTRACERLAIRLGWNRAERAHWRSREAVEADLRDAGLAARDLPLGGGTPASGNLLLLAQKPA